MTVTTVVTKTVQVRVAFGAPEAPGAMLGFTLSWPGGQPCLVLDCAGVTTGVLGEGDGVLAALQQWQAALAALASQLAPAPLVSPPPVTGPTAPATSLVEPPALAALAMTPAQLDGLAARWSQAQAAAAAAGETRT